MNVRAIVAWTLYDFANSAFAAVIFATIYAAYYALAVVGNAGGEGDLWWGRVVSVSMGLVALTSPFLGGVPTARASAGRCSSASRRPRWPPPR
jgi:UMF1 family MFS transporter